MHFSLESRNKQEEALFWRDAYTPCTIEEQKDVESSRAWVLENLDYVLQNSPPKEADGKYFPDQPDDFRDRFYNAAASVQTFCNPLELRPSVRGSALKDTTFIEGTSKVNQPGQITFAMDHIKDLVRYQCALSSIFLHEVAHTIGPSQEPEHSRYHEDWIYQLQGRAAAHCFFPDGMGL